MQGLQQSYSQYFNLHHRKSGHVFQGRYKAIVCDKDEYLLQLIRYIHLNPVRAGMVKEPEKYLYSGHGAYLQGKASETIDPSKVLSVMGGRARYRAFVSDGIKDGHREEFYEVSDQRFLGADGFGEKLQDEHEEPRAKKRRPLEKVVQELSQLLAVQPQVLRSADRSWRVSQARTKIGYILVRRQGYALDNEEAELGVRCIGAGIRDDDGALVAGLSVSAPAERMKISWSELVKETAEKISRSLGWSG